MPPAKPDLESGRLAAAGNRAAIEHPGVCNAIQEIASWKRVYGSQISDWADYVKHWLPELARVPADKIHRLWQLTPDEQQAYGVVLGEDYPLPIVEGDKWLKAHQDR